MLSKTRLMPVRTVVHPFSFCVQHSTLKVVAALFMTLGPSCGACRADVTSATETGFLIESEFTVAATPQQAYEKTGHISKWWESAHTYSGDAANLSLTLQAGASFSETLPDGGSVEHMRVVMAMPGSVLRLQGGLGPLQQEALVGTMTFTYVSEAKDGETPKTKVRCRYLVGGFRPGGCAEMAPPVDAVISLQLKGLRTWIESPQDATSTDDSLPSQATEHTMVWSDDCVSPEIAVDQFEWMVGRWLGPGLGGECEEVWTPSVGGQIQGMFQFSKDDQVIFRELMSLQKDEAKGWVLRLKHFGKELVGWEEKDDKVEFRLIKAEGKQAWFDGLTMERISDEQMNVYVVIHTKTGEAQEALFEYRLKPLQ